MIKNEVHPLTKPIVIGLDIGTTSVKAVAFNIDGKVAKEKEIGYPLLTPFPSWVEQDPIVIEQTTIKVISQLIDGIVIKHENILAIGLSSAMHSLICMDDNGNPLSPSITWADGRSSKQAFHIKQQNSSIYSATGTPIHPMSPLVKLLWMKETSFKPYLSATKFVSIKEFLLYRWFGAEIVDYAIASATGMFDLNTLSWNEEALKIAGITKDMLFTPVPPTTRLQGLRKDISLQMGLPENIPFVIGASDGPLANLGIGAINPGEVAITIGTSGAIRQIISKPKTDEFQETFCYAFTDHLSLIGGPTNNGGIVLQWLKETVGSHESYESMNDLAGKAPPGSENLLFLPYLNGERAPLWNAKVRGNIFGLSLQHKKEHIIRAGMEGVIFSIYYVGQALERLAGPPKKLLASGGFARSPLWLQILADVFNQEVQVPISHQSSAWGAAWIALYGIGQVKDLNSIKEHIPMQGRYIPKEENHAIYQEMFTQYKVLSESLNKYYLNK